MHSLTTSSLPLQTNLWRDSGKRAVQFSERKERVYVNSQQVCVTHNTLSAGSWILSWYCRRRGV